MTGVFDIFHVGHLELLRKAHELCSNIVVGLNSDAATSVLKGRSRPINYYENRRDVMEAIRYVDHVFEIDHIRVDKAIRMVKPKFWVKGGDYSLSTLDQDEVRAAKDVGAEIVIVPMVHGFSSTVLLQKLL